MCLILNLLLGITHACTKCDFIRLQEAVLVNKEVWSFAYLYMYINHAGLCITILVCVYHDAYILYF